MKKRVLSLFMALALCLTLLPTAALAETAGTARDGEPAGGVYTVGEDTAAQGEAALDEAVRAAQALIDALPEEATADNADELQARLIALDAALDALTDEQLAALDMTRYEALCAALAALTAEQAAHSHALCTHGSGCTVCPAGAKQSQTFATALTMGSDGVYANGVKVPANSGAITLSTGTYYLDQTISASRINIEGNVVLCLNDNNFEAAQNQCGVRIKDGATLTLCDCKGGGKITHGSYNGNPFYNGGVSVDTGAALILYSGSISDNTMNKTGYMARNGGGVTVEESASFTMYGGSISGNSATDGGGVYVGKNASFTMCGGSITGNTADGDGNNASDGNGAGVVVGEGAEFIMSGGSITGNNGGGYGGGVFVTTYNPDKGFTMSGGSITGNNGGSNGGVYVNTSSKIELSGGAQIWDNWTGGTRNESTGLYEKGSGTASNVLLAGSGDSAVTITVSGALTGAQPIGVGKSSSNMPTAGNPVKIAVSGGSYALTETDKTHFVSDADGYGTVYNSGDNAIYLKLAPTTHDHPICGEVCTHLGEGENPIHGSAEWTAIREAGDLAVAESTAGNYYLTANIVLADSWGEWKPANGVTLCLNGYSITQQDNKDTVQVQSGVTFTLCDCNGSGAGKGKITHATGAVDSGVNVAGTFLMYGGSISGNTTTKGGGVNVGNKGTFTMYGGSVNDNTADDDGGGVNVVVGGKFFMSGGEITGNTAGNDGSTAGSTESTGYGGGVHVSSTGTFEMSGDAVVSGNKVIGGSGGGVYISAGTFKMSGKAAVRKNTANDNCGGGVLLTGANDSSMADDAAICGNIAKNGGGGVYMSGSTFTMTGGSITGNEITGSGSGGGVYADGTFTMTGGSITDNKTTGNGGGVYKGSGTFAVSGPVRIEDNTTSNVFLLSGRTITIGADGLAESARIGVTAKTLGTGEYVTAATGADNGYYEGNLFSDVGGDYGVLREGDDVNLYNGVPHKHPICGKVCTHKDENGDPKHPVVEWKPIKAASDITDTLAEGNYYLAGSVQIDIGWSPQNDVHLCLNGQTLKRTGGFNAITVKKTLTLCDCDTEGRGAFQATGFTTSNGVCVDNSGTLELYGGTITGEQYGVKFEQYRSTFNMYGGTIKDSGTGVYMSAKGGNSFNLYGGTITGNGSGSGDGGGVYVGVGTFTMSGGEITGNSKGARTSAAGGVYVTGGSFVMSGGSITGNSITIRESNNAGLVNEGAGGVYVKSGRFEMSGGEITGNTVTNNSSKGMGGGVYVASNGSMSVSGAAKVTQNTVTGSGSGGGSNVYLSSGKTIAIGTGGLDSTASFGVATAEDVPEGSFAIIATDAKAGDEDCFLNETGKSYATRFANGKVVFLNGGLHEHVVCGAVCGEGKHLSDELWLPLTYDADTQTLYCGAEAVLNEFHSILIKDDGNGNKEYVYYMSHKLPSGNYYLVDNIALNGGEVKGVTTIGGQIRIEDYDKDVKLCLNGHTLSATNVNTPLLGISGTNELTLSDCVGGGVVRTADNGYNVVQAYGIGHSGTFTMYGGTISGAKTGVMLYNAGAFNMFGGTITGNECGVSAGVNNPVTLGGTVNITGNTKENLYLYSSGTKESAVINLHASLTQASRVGVSTNQTLSGEERVQIAAGAKGSLDYYTPIFTADAKSEGYVVTKEGESLYLALHTHDWEYTANGATITATCRNTDGACPNRSGGILTITAPDESTLTYDGSEKKAKLADSLTTAAPVTVDDIRYYTGDSLTGSELSGGSYPKDAGTYTASITVGGVTAEVTYTIAKATPTASNFTFTPPTDLTYNGKVKTANVRTAAGITGTGNYWVNYYDSLGRSVTPTDVLPANGVYTVKIDVPGGTNYNAISGLTDESWTFAITPRPVTVTVDAVSRAYGEQNPSFTAKVTGGSLADDESITDLRLFLYSLSAERAAVGPHDVEGLSSNINYTVTVDGAGKLTVTPKTLTAEQLELNVTGSLTKAYDGTDNAANVGARVKSGVLVGSDTLTITGSARYNSKDVKSANTITFTPDAITEGNYRLAADQTLAVTEGVSITPRVLTVGTVTTTPKTFDGYKNATFYVTNIELIGIVDGETLTMDAISAPGDYGIYDTAFDSAAAGRRTITGTVALLSRVTNYSFAGGKTTAPFTADGEIVKATPVITAEASRRITKNGVAVDISDWASFNNTDSGAKLTYALADEYTGVTINGTMLTAEPTTVLTTFNITVSAAATTNFTVPVEKTITVTVDDKITPTLDGAVTLSPAAITYGEPLSTIDITGTMKAGETVVEGTFAWQNPDAVLSARTHNDIAWTFTPLDTNAYAGASGTATVTVNKAAQSGTVRMASYTYGTAPSAPTLENRTGDPSAAVSYYCAKEGSASTQEWSVRNPPELDAGTYRMYASIAETLNYNRGNADYCEFTVWKAAPTYATKPAGLTAKYGQTLGTVALVNPEGNTPGTWSWQTPETVLDQLGTLSYDANFRPDDTDNYLGVVGVSIQVTVGPADGGSLGTETLAQKYTDGSERTYTPDWSGLPAGQVWSYSSGYSVSAGSSAALTRQDVAADGSSLTYAISGGAAGDVVTITLKATCSNYEDFTITLVITLTEKDEQAALRVTGGSTVVYGQTLALGTSGGSGSGAVTYTVANGTGEATIDANGVLTPVRVGSVTVTAHKAGDSGYNAVSSAPFTVTITQATPTGAPKYTAITSGGKTLRDAALTLTGSTLSPNAGTLVWVGADGSVLPDDTAVEANKSYSWRFTPDDPNYTSLTGSVVPYPVSYGGGGSAAAGITVPVTGSRDTVHISASVSNGTAEVAGIERSELEKVGTDSGVTIDLSGLDKGVTGVTLPKDTIRSISESAADGVTIKLPNAELRVDQKTLASAAEQAKGDRVQLVVETDSRAKSTMTDAQKQALDGMRNAAALEAYFVSGGQRIRDFNGGEVELSIPYQASGAIRAWYLKEDGTREPVSARYDKENARLILRHFSHYVIEELESGMGYAACAKDDTCPLAAFADLVPTAWYHDGVHYCIENGLMQGVSATSFLPNGSTTRAQLVTILWRLEGSPETAGAESFTDVKDGAWYAQAVRWAADRGVVKGYDNGGFGPDDAVTREQMVTILYRYAQYKGYDVSVGEDTNILSFNDALAVSGYAVPAMQWACGSGLMTGIAQDGGMALAPKDTTTRVQTATLMMRFYTECAR